MLERIKCKLECWKRRYISLGDRITLIKAVISNLPIYYMSLFKMPVKITQQIDKLQRDFLWEGTLIRKTTWLVGNRYVNPKKKGA